MRKGRRSRKSSAGSKDINAVNLALRKDSAVSSSNHVTSTRLASETRLAGDRPQGENELRGIASGDEADTDGERVGSRTSQRERAMECGTVEEEHATTKESRPRRKKHRKRRRWATEVEKPETDVRGQPAPQVVVSGTQYRIQAMAPVVEPSTDRNPIQSEHLRPPFNFRAVSIRSVMPKTLAVGGSTEPRGSSPQPKSQGATAAASDFGIRRAASLPDRLNQRILPNSVPSPQPSHMASVTIAKLSPDPDHDSHGQIYISKTAAIILLVVSTALVAVCAEFLLSSINSLVDDTGLNEVFVGLIILPVVGNTAELITAVTVATKNKMDLAIGVAVGSSIQIGMKCLQNVQIAR